ncbi:MAG: perosamine synthetase [Solirubrobacteraceae bacterium]|nr:perosamine synthetase [Solirubrobacteraceae bacterium]
MATYDRFAIGFDQRDRARLHELWDGVIDSNRWSEGELTAGFEAAWSAHNDLGAVALSSWTGGALAALEWAGVRGRSVVVPSNTFMATPLAVIAAGGMPVFGDCRRDDLCLSVEEVERLLHRHDPAAVFLVHIGGHIAFDAPAIAQLCRERDVKLIEDCAHAHGAEWNGARPGSYGDAGIYSLYATKTISTGEGGVLVSRHAELLDFARAFRNYAKPDYAGLGLNFRMSEFTAALGLVQIERLPEIVAWKNAVARAELDPRYPSRLTLPDGMTSGLYKYIVFDWLERSTGRVYDEPCHRIMNTGDELPNSDWVAANHSCVPLYYRPDSEDDG